MSENCFANGLKLSFFGENKAFESLDNLTSENKKRANVRNLIRLLMLEQVNGWWKVMNWMTIKFAFFKPSERERGYFLEALQEGLVNIGEQLKQGSLTEQQYCQAEILISNILCYLPFAYPTKGTDIKVPQLINGQWQMVSYEIEPIELTANRKNFFPIFNDSDRAWAYGLKPSSNSEGVSPWLIYSGTTYPSGDGFTAHIMADFVPFRTVGHGLFVGGKDKIESWLKQFRDQKTRVTGLSLGGSLALLTACCFGNLCHSIMAFNPAGLVENNTLKEIDHWDEFCDEEKPPVYVVKQGADPVSALGTWKSSWIILFVKKCSSFFTHHFTAFACSKHAQYQAESANADNNKWTRKVNNIVWYTGGRAVVYTFILLPWRYLLIPMYRLAKIILATTFLLASALVNMVVSLVTKIAMAFIKAVATLISSTRLLGSKANQDIQPTSGDKNPGDIENQLDADQNANNLLFFRLDNVQSN